jgi:hypothetical protein
MTKTMKRILWIVGGWAAFLSSLPWILVGLILFVTKPIDWYVAYFKWSLLIMKEWLS